MVETALVQDTLLEQAMQTAQVLLGGGPLVFSASQFEEESRCTRRWWFRRVVKLPEKQTTAQAFGTVFAAVVERWLKNEEPFPQGWDEGLSPIEADTQRRMLAKATEGPNPVLRREDAVHVEAEFTLVILPEENGQPEVQVLGYIDLVRKDGVADHKSTKSMRWAKSAEELRQNIQLTVYGKAWLEDRRSDKVADPEVVRLAHIYYVKDPNAVHVEWREAEPPLTPREIEVAWEERVAQSRRMRDLHLQQKPQHDKHAQETWPKIQASGTPYDAQNRKGACGDFGGCPFGSVCGGAYTVAEFRETALRQQEAAEREARGFPPARRSEEMSMSMNLLLGGRAPAAVAAPPAPPPAAPAAPSGSPFGFPVATTAPAPSAPPAPPAIPTPQAAPPAPPAIPTPQAAPQAPAAPAPTPPPATPFPQVGQVAPAAPSWAQPPAPKMRDLAPGAPPWARRDCTACVDNSTGVELVTGIAYKKGDACRICVGRQRSSGLVSSDQYDVKFENGQTTWTIKPDIAAQAAQAGLPASGSIRLAWMSGTATPAPVQAPQPAPAPAPAPVVTPVPQPLPTAAVPQQGNPAPAPQIAVVNAPAFPVPAPVAPQAQATQTINANPAQATVNVPAPAPSPTPPAPQQGDGKPRERKGKGFTLGLGCAPQGPSNQVVRLDEVFGRWAAKLAAAHGVQSYYGIDESQRREQLAANAELIADEEGFGTKFVIAPLDTADLAAFAVAFRPYAGMVVGALPRLGS